MHKQLPYTIISHGLYISYPIFHCSLYCGAASVTNNSCTYLSPFILRSQLRDPHFFQKCCHFQYNNKNMTTLFERNEDRVTGFLK